MKCNELAVIYNIIFSHELKNKTEVKENCIFVELPKNKTITIEFETILNI